jgi:thiol-disulfide isomerase/thioredoxin
MKLNFTLFVLCFLFGACNDQTTKETNTESSSPTDIGKVQLQNFNGVTIDLNKYKGQAVFINFWATWCKPCVAEIPTIKNAIDFLKNEKIKFLFATDETPEQVEGFEAIHNFGFDYVKALNMDALNIPVLPTTFIFDKDGKQVFSDMGYRKWDDSANLQLLLKIVNQE